MHCQHYSDKITVLADMRIKTLGFHGEKKLVKILANTAMNGICNFLVHFFFVEMAYKVHLNGFMLIVFYVVEIIRFSLVGNYFTKFENKNTCVRTSYSHLIAPVQNYFYTKICINCAKFILKAPNNTRAIRAGNAQTTLNILPKKTFVIILNTRCR